MKNDAPGAPTPETDQLAESMLIGATYGPITANLWTTLARRLERERNAALADNRQLRRLIERGTPISEYEKRQSERAATAEAECDRLRVELEACREDVARYRLLRDYVCNSLHLTRDGDHACNYVTAAQWIEEYSPDDFADVDPSEIQRMKDANTIWRLQIYPDTPVGFYVWHGATLDAAIDAARKAGG